MDGEILPFMERAMMICIKFILSDSVSRWFQIKYFKMVGDTLVEGTNALVKFEELSKQCNALSSLLAVVVVCRLLLLLSTSSLEAVHWGR